MTEIDLPNCGYFITSLFPEPQQNHPAPVHDTIYDCSKILGTPFELYNPSGEYDGNFVFAVIGFRTEGQCLDLLNRLNVLLRRRESHLTATIVDRNGDNPTMVYLGWTAELILMDVRDLITESEIKL